MIVTSSNGEHLIKVSCYCHLFVQLWTLGKICRALEVWYCEHIGPTFTCCWNNLWGVNLHKTLWHINQIITYSNLMTDSMQQSISLVARGKREIWSVAWQITSVLLVQRQFFACTFLFKSELKMDSKLASQIQTNFTYLQKCNKFLH